MSDQEPYLNYGDFEATQEERRQEAYDDLLCSIWLYVDWDYVTRQLRTDQREMWLRAIQRHIVHMGDEPVSDADWKWWT